jgi:transposase
MRNEHEIIEKIYGAEYKVTGYSEADGQVTISLKSVVKSAVCPYCGQESASKHATKRREIADTPLRGKPVKLVITAYQWNCENAECHRKVFNDGAFMAEKFRGRTIELDQLILAVAYEFSSEGASRILKRMGVSVSNDTIDKMIARIEIEDNPDIERIGVDDFAYKKGRTYCTAIYDLDTHKPIALFDGRSGEELKKWLGGHKKVNVVARDRDRVYAKAISDALPDCRQVSDKFHLMQSLIDAIKEILGEVPREIYIKDGEIIKSGAKYGKINTANLKYDNSPPIDPETGEEIQITGRKILSKDYLSVKKNRTDPKSKSRFRGT